MTSGAGSAVAPHSAGAAVVWLVAAIGVVVTGLMAVSRVVGAPPSTTIDAIAGALALYGISVAFLLSGAIIASRQPQNAIGLLLITPGVAVPVSQLALTWLAGIVPPPTNATPVLWLLVWFGGWSWILLIFPIFNLLLVFPTGRLLSRRWRLAVALELAMIGIFLLAVAFSAELVVLVDDKELWSIANPIGFLPATFFDTVISGPWGLGLLTLTIVSVWAMVLRFRRGSTDERQQLKWPTAAIAFFGVVYGAALVASSLNALPFWKLLFGVAIAFIPVSVAIAVLRYRLFEIDRIISRTLGWAIVTGALVAVFGGLVVGLQALLAGVTQGQTLAVAASTLVAFALFQPVRRRVQTVVDRRFDRARYDGERTAAAFAERLRDQMDLASLTDDIAGTVDTALRPGTIGVWLRAPKRDGSHPLAP